MTKRAIRDAHAAGSAVMPSNQAVKVPDNFNEVTDNITLTL